MPKGASSTVGRFTVYANGDVTGPKEYLASHDINVVLKNSAVFNSGFGTGPLHLQAAVALQTHYAGWAGTREMLRFKLKDDSKPKARKPKAKTFRRRKGSL